MRHTRAFLGPRQGSGGAARAHSLRSGNDFSRATSEGKEMQPMRKEKAVSGNRRQVVVSNRPLAATGVGSTSLAPSPPIASLIGR